MSAQTQSDDHQVAIVVPIYDEGANVSALLERIEVALGGAAAHTEVVFVDDGSDDAPARVADFTSRGGALSARLVRRERGVGGLSGAVAHGFAITGAPVVVVMDGDLQHPPETLPLVLGALGKADVVVASRYAIGGSAGGLNGGWRAMVSKTSTHAAKALFPVRLRGCSDPMTGFFAIRREALSMGAPLRPAGFKILLELLATRSVAVAEVPLVFAQRQAGQSKAGIKAGMEYAFQLASLKVRALAATSMVRFAAVGAIGTVANLAILSLLLGLGAHYLPAAIVAGELTIAGNFLLAERYVFRGHRIGRLRRGVHVTLVNNVELLARTPLLAFAVEAGGMNPVLASALLLVLAFVGRYAYTRSVVYRLGATKPLAAAALEAPEQALEAQGDLDAEPAPTSESPKARSRR